MNIWNSMETAPILFYSGAQLTILFVNSALWLTIQDYSRIVFKTKASGQTRSTLVQRPNGRFLRQPMVSFRSAWAQLGV